MPLTQSKNGFQYDRNTQKMAAELVNTATSEKLPDMNWTTNIQICELVAHDQRWSVLPSASL